ncbi:hypothetical protein BAUCODRAFT_34106 [Baudoinia panamericana UAMH 10762]|uniref:Uncharacterized protein n=1 Tax=Baudoinia panamericana (strain UAMH 10762) TaxID=717646 RepID=M2NCS5_BAUPA|nr:uncharacterized protein BAUCODRAFT_34106 [Baudoinia panamericana UAMH 10762]EMC96715.1 hypothetical protein BAUCODRAFT_34106 [Baudoinia panamericana UAMH 10762]
MLTYAPLVEGIEKRLSHERLDEIIADFRREAKQRYGIDRMMLSRGGDLFVEKVPAGLAFEIRETEGMETIFDVSLRRQIFVPILETSGNGASTGPIVPSLQPPPPTPAVASSAQVQAQASGGQQAISSSGSRGSVGPAKAK